MAGHFGTIQERHGLAGVYPSEYQIWIQMNARCYNPNGRGYEHYGKRGISVCEQWRHSFSTFIGDMGPRPDGMTLGRKDNEGNYSPENCVWASYATQSRNKRNNIWIEFEGRRMILADWAKEIGVAMHTLRNRLENLGWSIERALTASIDAPRKNEVVLTYQGKTQTLVEWSKEIGVKHATLKTRVRKGLSVEQILSRDVRCRK